MITPPAEPASPLAELAGAGVRLGGARILDGIDLCVRPGEVVALLGANGAGKTTALRALCGLIPLSDGTARIAGFDVEADPVAARTHLGYVPDGAPLYSNLSGREHLALTAALRPDACGTGETAAAEGARLLGAFELAGAADQPVGRYSRGMRQKLALACALLPRPRLLVLDEPLNGLDATSAAAVLSVLRAHASRGGAVLFSSHLLESAERVSTRVVILDAGRVLADGTVAELRRTAGIEQGLAQVFVTLTRAPDPDETARTILGEPV